MGIVQLTPGSSYRGFEDIYAGYLGYVWKNTIGMRWSSVFKKASIANDKPMLDVFANRWDPHTLNMRDFLGYPYPSKQT